MPTPLTLERVRRDVDVFAHTGLDLEAFVTEVDESLRRAVPFAGMCIATMDPASHLLTGTFKFGDLAGRDERDADWGLIEYGDPEPTSFTELLRAGVAAESVHRATGGDVTRSTRIRDFMASLFGYTDEARVVLRSDQLWGGAALFRGGDERPFGDDEIAYLASLSGNLAAGLRAGMLVQLTDVAAAKAAGPVVVVVDSEDRLAQFSAGAQERLGDLLTTPRSTAVTSMIGSLVAAARRYAAGVGDVVPRARVRSRSGMWFVLNASPLHGVDGSRGSVVVTVEEARPPEIIPLVVAAFGLTPRERDVTQLVLQGAETKAIAAALHLSAWTVQDHLKSVFDKADVRSRRELIARIYFDQYVPRINTGLDASGWFAG